MYIYIICIHAVVYIHIHAVVYIYIHTMIRIRIYVLYIYKYVIGNEKTNHFTQNVNIKFFTVCQLRFLFCRGVFRHVACSVT